MLVKSENSLGLESHATPSESLTDSASAQLCAGRTQPGSGLAWLSFAVGLALTIPLIWRAWTIIGPNTYAGSDGKSWQALLGMFREFVPPFHLNIQNPLQGAAGFASPMNIWANPVFWPFFSDDALFATQASTLIAYIAMATAVFVLARAWRLPLGASIAGALSSIIVFPLFSFIFGFATLLAIAPEAAMGAALMIVAASLSRRVNDLRWGAVVGAGLLLALILGYSVYSNPAWFVGAAFIFAPLFAFCILDVRSARTIAARVAAFALAFVLLYAAGLVDYVLTLFGYSARIYFSSEWFRPQDVSLTSWSFESPRLLWTYLFFLSGWAVGLIFGDRTVRKAVLVCLLLFAVFLIEGGIYLFAPIHWSAPLPLYYEILIAPIYALGAMAGYCSFVAAVWHEFVPEPSNAVVPASPSSAASQRHPRPFAWMIRAVPVLSGIALVPALGTWYVNDEIYAHKYTPRLINLLTEPWAATEELVGYLRDNIGFRNTGQFRGAALMRPYFNYESWIVVASLWRDLVPTLNLYNTFEPPPFKYFFSHLPRPKAPGAPDPSSTELPINRVAWLLYAPFTAPANKILQALGVRYVIQAAPEDEPKPIQPLDHSRLRLETPPRTVAGKQIAHAVYEYESPNVGNYSPTEVVIARNAVSMLQALWSASFDPRQSVILEQAIEKPLVKAAGGEMLFERGAIRITAHSTGPSLVLLPVQYSRCLAVDETEKAKLFRANFLQTALLFEHTVDVRIRFDYGLFRSRCRKQDLADLATLGIFDDKEVRSPGADPRPYVVSNFADLPRAFEAVVRKLIGPP